MASESTVLTDGFDLGSGLLGTASLVITLGYGINQSVAVPVYPGEATLSQTGVEQATLAGISFQQSTLSGSGVQKSTLTKRTS